MEKIWQDRKRILGMPISFTKYILTEDRLILEEGLLKTVENEIMLYRIQDITLVRTLSDKLFGVGTVELNSSDKTHPVLRLLHIKNPRSVKQLLSDHVEKERMRRRVGTHEFIGDDVSDPEENAVDAIQE